MSAADKPDPIRGGQYLLDLLAEDEAERLDGLSAAELQAEAKREGLSRGPGPEEIIARVKAVAARAPQPEIGRAAQAVDAVEEPAPESRVIPIRRFSRLGWILAAAAVVLVVIAAVKRPQIIAAFHEPTPREVAESLRDDAVGNCEQGAWAACRDMLDHAAGLDPEGETEERVQKARADIAKATTPAPPRDHTPQP